MRIVGLWKLLTVVAVAAAPTTAVVAQEPESTTRQAVIEQARAEKLKTLHPYVPSTYEKLMNKADEILANSIVGWHPFFGNAYSGGGFGLGVGYAKFVSPYNFLDVRGSYSVKEYKRVEAEFVAPRLFHRRGDLSVLGGWREATEVGFYGIGMSTSKDHRTNYDFTEPYGAATLTLWPTRRLLMLRGGVELARWSQDRGRGSFPSVETVYTSLSLPGLGAATTYIHSQGTVGFDWRTSPGYSRRGGFYAVTAHDYTDRDSNFGFQRVDYEVIQHVPILREAWVLSLRGRAATTFAKSEQQIPFFMLPYLGGGHSLRGFQSWRFRDRNSLLLQAEWRITASRFFDTALFYDAGKVTARTAALDFNRLKSDYGFGVRFHGPVATPLRVDLARSNEGLALVLSATPVF
jgi:hypothetical protein